MQGSAATLETLAPAVQQLLEACVEVDGEQHVGVAALLASAPPLRAALQERCPAELPALLGAATPGALRAAALQALAAFGPTNGARLRTHFDIHLTKCATYTTQLHGARLFARQMAAGGYDARPSMLGSAVSALHIFEPGAAFDAEPIAYYAVRVGTAKTVKGRRQASFGGLGVEVGLTQTDKLGKRVAWAPAAECDGVVFVVVDKAASGRREALAFFVGPKRYLLERGVGFGGFFLFVEMVACCFRCFDDCAALKG